jgi:hypothetical protein
MRGDKVFHVYGVQTRDIDVHFGTYASHALAEARVVELAAREEWAARYHDGGFVIREGVVETDFVVPPRPKPRDRYLVQERALSESGRPVDVVVSRRDAAGAVQPVCEYRRDYGLLHTFEPFRQGDRELALISRSYVATAVLDLATGEVIAEEPVVSEGFCPVGFYVPDWWDVQSGHVIPGSPYWTADHEWPAGDFGFVWGCIWGDDSSWKVQYLDLSRVQQGVIRREERFGYVELATDGHEPPWLDPDAKRPSAPPPFIRVERYEGKMQVSFDVEMAFDLATGEARDWKRTRNSHWE